MIPKILWCWVGLIAISYAGLFPESYDSDAAFKNGEQLSSILYPGTLIADSSDGTFCLDYASALPYAVDGSSETSYILGCGHFLTRAQARDPHCTIYFKSNSGTTYRVTKTVNKWCNSAYKSLDIITTDLALYQIEAMTQCCSTLCFPEEVSSESIMLTTLSCGWHVNLAAGKQSIDTTRRPASWSQNFKIGQGFLSTCLAPDLILKLSRGNHTLFYYGSSSDPLPQTFSHDSGGIWFRENNGKYELWGLTSHTQGIPFSTDCVEQPLASLPCSFLGSSSYTLNIHTIKDNGRKHSFGDFLTSLPQHKDWIQKHIEGAPID